MTADKLELNQDELGRRRRLAHARYERESARKILLGAQMEAERQASHLRAWIAGKELQLEAKTDGELSRMLHWASDELAALEKMAEPAQLTETLQRQNLFPEVDDLADPLGDPPPRWPWGR